MLEPAGRVARSPGKPFTGSPVPSWKWLELDVAHSSGT